MLHFNQLDKLHIFIRRNMYQLYITIGIIDILIEVRICK